MAFIEKFYFVVFFTIFVWQTKMLAESKNCEAKIAESMPEGLVFNSSVAFNSTFSQLIDLMSRAEKSIDIASYYWTLLGTDVMPEPDKSSWNGSALLQTIIDVANKRNVSVRIAVNQDVDSENSTDLKLLSSVADIRYLNFTRIVGAGILHTKFIVVDDQHFYVGSANMDWRSLTQVKELGIVVNSCPQLAIDLLKIFEIYWFLGLKNASIPEKWPKEYSTNYNSSQPLSIGLNENAYNVYLSSSPKSFCADGRTNDIDAILSVINNAKSFIYIAVMDYFPTFLYTDDHQFWPVIDDALKKAALERKIHVRLLASHWTHTRNSAAIFLKSLAAFNNSKILGGSIEAKQFIVPSFTPQQADIPFARVNHNKYMVTDNSAYIGTSNWSADYFISTGGVAIVLNPNSTSNANLRDDLELIFKRDWFSTYANNV